MARQCITLALGRPLPVSTDKRENNPRCRRPRSTFASDPHHSGSHHISPHWHPLPSAPRGHPNNTDSLHSIYDWYDAYHWTACPGIFRYGLFRACHCRHISPSLEVLIWTIIEDNGFRLHNLTWSLKRRRKNSIVPPPGKTRAKNHPMSHGKLYSSKIGMGLSNLNPIRW